MTTDKSNLTPDNKPADKGPGVRFPPPLMVVPCWAVAYTLHQFWPLALPPSIWLQIAGIVLIAIGLGLIVVIGLRFRKARTHIEPWKPSTALVTTGLFSFSRNPIYLAFCIITAGVGLLVNSLWVVISALPVALLIQVLVISKEEAYLENQFGDAYRAYKNRVRRWF